MFTGFGFPFGGSGDPFGAHGEEEYDDEELHDDQDDGPIDNT